MKKAGLLQLIGGLIVLIYALLLTVGAFASHGGFSLIVFAMNFYGYYLAGIFGILFIIFSFLMMLAGVWYEKNTYWALMSVVMSILILLVPFGGFFIGPLIAGIGGALGMKGGK